MSAVSGRTAAVAAALALVYVLWGSTYLGNAIAIESIPPLLMSALRFLTAGLLFLALARLAGPYPRLGRRQWLAAALTGGALFLLGNGGVVWAQQHVPSGVAALIVASVPLWMAVLDRVVYGNRLDGRAVGGLLLGFGGIALLVDPWSEGGLDIAGAIVLVLASLAWAMGSLLSRDADLPAQPLLAAGMQTLAGGAMLVVAGAALGELGRLDVAAVSARSLLATGYLVVFGSLIAFTAYAWLLRNARTSLVGTYAYVNPVVAVVLGWAILDETLNARTIVSGAIIIAAVALIVSARRVEQRAPAPRVAVPARAR